MQNIRSIQRRKEKDIKKGIPTDPKINARNTLAFHSILISGIRLRAIQVISDLNSVPVSEIEPLLQQINHLLVERRKLQKQLEEQAEFDVIRKTVSKIGLQVHGVTEKCEVIQVTLTSLREKLELLG